MRKKVPIDMPIPQLPRVHLLPPTGPTLPLLTPQIDDKAIVSRHCVDPLPARSTIHRRIDALGPTQEVADGRPGLGRDGHAAVERWHVGLGGADSGPGRFVVWVDAEPGEEVAGVGGGEGGGEAFGDADPAVGEEVVDLGGGED